MFVTFQELRNANLTRCKLWHPGGVTDWSPADWVMAFIGEFGEACNKMKKMKRIEDHIAGNKTHENATHLQRKIADELADAMIYLDLLAARCNVDLEQAVISKFNRKSSELDFDIFIGGDNSG